MHKTDEVVEEKHRKAVADYFSTKIDFWDIVYDEQHSASGLSLIQKEDMNSRQQAALNYVDEFAAGRKMEILDIGCGTGILMQKLWERGHHTDGVDISEKMVEAVLQKIKINSADAGCKIAAVENLPYDSKSKDIITAMGVIEYLMEPEKGLAEINRVLKDDGILIISVPNIIKIQNMLDPYYYFVRGSKYLLNKVRRKKYRQVDHLLDLSSNKNFSNKRFYLKNFISTAEKTGFKLLDLSCIGFGPFTFWKKNIFKDKTTVGLSKKLMMISSGGSSNFLRLFPNRWVLKMKKTRNDN